MTKPAAIIIGGGLHGCSTALHLALRGMPALVIEKDHVARHASGVNAGGVRRLGRDPAELALSVASMALWHRIESLVDDDCGFESHGQIKVAETEAELDTLRARAASVRALGFDHEEIIGRDELRALLPALSGHCVGAMVCRSDGAALPFRTTLAFKRKAEQLGQRFIEGVRVDGMAREGGEWVVRTSQGTRRAPYLVNTAGAWGGRVAAWLGEPVPIEAVAPMLMITAPMPRFVRPVVGATGRTLSFKQFANGTVMVGGGMLGRADPDTNATELDFAKLAINAQTASILFPAMRGATVVRSWAGIEGRMPDQIPVVGPSGTSDGVWHAFGFSAHGFQLGPIVGSVLADLIVGGRTELPIDALAIGRFKIGTPDSA